MLLFSYRQYADSTIFRSLCFNVLVRRAKYFCNPLLQTLMQVTVPTNTNVTK